MVVRVKIVHREGVEHKIVVISSGSSSESERHRKMVDTLKMPIFHGFVNEDTKRHLFCM